MTTWVVGDVHGCINELLDLFDQLALTSSDRVVFVGDLVDRGPSPREVLDLALQHTVVLGNHEDRLLRHRRAGKDATSLHHPEHRRSFESLSDAHWAALERCPLYVELEATNTAIVHAGTVPGVPLAQVHPKVLLHMQMVVPPPQTPWSDAPVWVGDEHSHWPGAEPRDARFWAHFYVSSTSGVSSPRIVFGHTVLDRPWVTDHFAGIDTGCVYGGALTALDVEGWRTVSVPARKAYFPRSARRVPYALAKGIHTYA